MTLLFSNKYLPLIMTFLFIAYLVIYFPSSAESNQENESDHESQEKEMKGPHGGKVLNNGDITVELVFLENSKASIFQAWVDNDGEAITKNNLDFTISLMRIDGKTEKLQLTKSDLPDAEATEYISGVVNEPHSFNVMVDITQENNRHTWNFDSFHGRVEIEQAIAIKAGIKSELANAGQIKQTLTVYGKAIADPNTVSNIRARFPGTITKMRANIGDVVKAGDVLAEIESNESLKRYNLTAPLSGVITARNGNPGELAQQQVLLTVANFDQLWVELKIFPSQLSKISIGQLSTIFTDELQIQSSIKHLLPSKDGQAFKLARVPIDNSQGQWYPGLLLAGKIVIKNKQVPLVIDNRALQSIEGNSVVFIQVGTRYEVRSLKLGLSDSQFTEVLEGLNVGDKYVVNNSYLLKADLEKSSAEHHD